MRGQKNLMPSDKSTLPIQSSPTRLVVGCSSRGTEGSAHVVLRNALGQTLATFPKVMPKPALETQSFLARGCVRGNLIGRLDFASSFGRSLTPGFGGCALPSQGADTDVRVSTKT